MERGVVLLMERGVCGRVTRRQDGVVLLTDPRNFREKSVCVGVYNTELMNVVWSCSWNAVCGHVTKRQDGAVLLTDPRICREKRVPQDCCSWV